MPSTISSAPTLEAVVRAPETIVRRRAAHPRKAQTLTPRIIHITAELWPYAWSGGLGQAVAELAHHQTQNGRDVTVVAPLYRAARLNAGALIPACESFLVHQGGAEIPINCLEMQPRAGGPRVVFIDHPASFDRDGLYGDANGEYGDNDRRFSLLVLAALEFVRREAGGERGIVHAHDWHAALAPVYMRIAHAEDPAFARMASVVSVHNGGYQGLFDRATLPAVGLPDELWSFERMEWFGRLSFLKGGLRYADVVTTVSETHAQEMRTDIGGFGLQDVFRGLGDRLVGIRNGIDERRWNPETDSEIHAAYGPRNLAGKARCKAEFQLANRLPRADVPVFAMSARMVAQKGVDLVLASRAIRESHAQFVFHGQGESRYEEAICRLAAEHPQRIAARTCFSDRFEHRLLAGADFLLMPSLYEPCGLTQMRAQRYGTLPVARRTGGLAETIVDGETGFLFDGFTADEFDAAMRRAIALAGDRTALKRRAVDAMCRDFSWALPLAAYDQVYRRALAAR